MWGADGGWISVWRADNSQVWRADGGWILVWRADNSQVWGADGGWISVAGSRCGGLIIVRCGELMVAEVITWCGGIMSKRLALS